MKQNNQNQLTFNLYEKLCCTELLKQGFKLVKKNRGSPGIDGKTIKEFSEHFEDEIAQLSSELINWKYIPQPVKRVRIPKPGRNKGFRNLGIPTVRDRVVQTTLKIILEPILDPKFSDSSFGFRPNRDQKQALHQAQEYVKSGKIFVVDIDLEKFFDKVNHDKLIHRLSLFIFDKRILKLVGNILRSGIFDNGIFSVSMEGTMQGGPLSPLLSNLVLDELDKELEKRKFQFVRYADDCNIFVGSQKAVDRAMINITNFIEKRLKLKVNQNKSKVALSSYVKFLGMTILICGTLLISNVAMNRAMNKTMELIPRGSHETIGDAMKRTNCWYVGWSNYFKISQISAQFGKIEAHIRRRFRARLVYQQKSKRNLYNKLIKMGVSEKSARAVFSNNKTWKLSHLKPVEKAYSNSYFIDTLGQKIISKDDENHWLKGIWKKAP